MRGVMRPSSVVRWILVVPSAVVAWVFAFFVGLVLFVCFDAPCRNSDAALPRFCGAPWFEVLKIGVAFFGIGLSATLVVVVSAVVAPSHRTAVAWAAVVVGAIVAIKMGSGGEASVEAVVAIACGVLAAFAMSWVYRKSGSANVSRRNVVPNA